MGDARREGADNALAVRPQHQSRLKSRIALAEEVEHILEALLHALLQLINPRFQLDQQTPVLLGKTVGSQGRPGRQDQADNNQVSRPCSFLPVAYASCGSTRHTPSVIQHALQGLPRCLERRKT